MNEFWQNVLAEHGIWAVLFIGLLAWFLREFRLSHKTQLDGKDAEISRLSEDNIQLNARYERMADRYEQLIDKMTDNMEISR